LGPGFYSSRRAEVQYGIARLQVAVRLLNPLGPLDSLDADGVIGNLMEQFRVDYMRQAMLAEGYDGLVVRFAPGDEWAIAFHNEQVRIVVER